jgi:hypothetical protein
MNRHPYPRHQNLARDSRGTGAIPSGVSDDAHHSGKAQVYLGLHEKVPAGSYQLVA